MLGNHAHESLTCKLASPEKEAAGQTAKPRCIRIVYLVSRDRVEQPKYTAAIEHAIRDLQRWYARQLGGPTFRLSEPVVEVAHSDKTADWWYGNPNGEHKDDWGFNNTFDEARQLVGARKNDPHFVWVSYSDGPGNRGRAGSGFAHLPEDDLLGLVGDHPTEKDPLRWIAGLGHELGHALGLPHPEDTEKDYDAIMCCGIYGKYPDHTYLTEEDKQTLMHSPFIYHEDGSPVFQKEVATRYKYSEGAFDCYAGGPPFFWTETKDDESARYNFVESNRDAERIILHDRSRNMTINLPINGGQSSWSTDNGSTWHELYHISTPLSITPGP